MQPKLTNPGSVAEKPAGGASAIDVLDHVLDRGIVIDAWMQVSLGGIDLITVETRVLVASIQTYLERAQAVAQVGLLAARHLSDDRFGKVVAEEQRSSPGLSRPSAKRSGETAQNLSTTAKSGRHPR